MPVRNYDQKTNYMFPPCLDDWCAPDHRARIFSDLVDRIDVSGLCEIKRMGCPRFAPRMMTKVLLWAYANGIRASRKIEEHLHSDVVYMWLSGRQTPDFRTICDFRTANEAALDSIFAQVVTMARMLGMATLGLVALDGTKIRASAGIDSFKTVKEWNEALAEAKQKVAEIMAEVERQDRLTAAELGDEPSAVKLPDSLATAERRAAKIEALLAHLPEGIDETTLISSTDPDARFLHTPTGSMPAYNAELVVTPDQIVVGAGLTNEPVDQNQLKPGLEMAERVCGEKPVQVVADCGFNRGENLKYMEEQRLDGYIPESAEKNIGKDLRARPELFGKAQFQYDAEHDCYRCPAGETMCRVNRLKRRSKYAHQEVMTYRAERGKCLKCPLKAQCTRSKNPVGRSVTRDDYEEERTRMRAKLKAPAGRAIYARRKTIAEPTIGQIKVTGGLRQFLLRGLRKVTMEWTWATAAHSLLKITRRVDDGTVELAWAGC
jgi:transposase